MDSTDMNASTHKGSLIGKRVRVNPVGAVNHFELVYGRPGSENPTRTEALQRIAER
jgi:hypothetical protein